jgi:hypothetical protein
VSYFEHGQDKVHQTRGPVKARNQNDEETNKGNKTASET